MHVIRQTVSGHVAKRHQSFFAAFSHDAKHPLIQRHMQGFEFDQLGHSQTTGVQQLQHGFVAQTKGGIRIGCRQQCIDLLFRQSFGNPQGLLGSQHSEGGVDFDNALTQCPTVITFKNR